MNEESERSTADRGESTIHPYESSRNRRDLFKIAVQSPLSQVGKTQLEYAIRSQPRESGGRITLMKVVQRLDSRFVLPLMPMGVDYAKYFSKCNQAAVNGLAAHHNKLNISGYEVKELTADATC